MSEDKKRAIVVFISTLLIFAMIAYIAVTPRSKENFFQLYALGETRMTERYYPNNDTNVPNGTSVKWYLGTTNFMGSAQLAIVKAKLGNQTLSIPNETEATPAPLPMLSEFRKVLQNDETWEFPFIWEITNTTQVGNLTYLTLNINGVETYVEDVGAKDGYNYRIIFELWTFDVESNDIIFGWKASNERRAAWLQLWFNATTLS
jgi:uncharacterized membrane protein